jgi:GalNAc5-diNAcBac-PP-undecaprenol beta-1,3-glucosyltransferase
MGDKRVVILLAACNRANLIAETLDSILAQTYKNWECIIVDDYSEDKTFEIVQKYCNSDPRFSYFLKTKKYNKGLSGTRNYGLDLAQKRSADFIQFFDDDDLMHPRKLELQVIPFKQKADLNFTVCKFEKLINEGQTWKVVKQDNQLKYSHLGDSILVGEMKMNSLGPLWRSSFIQKFRFDENLKYAEEWELYTRIGYLYPTNYEVVNRYLFQYRKHEKTLTLRADVDYERRKTSAIIRIKILEFLTENKLHTKKSILFLARTFLIYFYNPDLVRQLQVYIKNNPDFSIKVGWFLQVGLFIGKLHGKIIRKFSKWV